MLQRNMFWTPTGAAWWARNRSGGWRRQLLCHWHVRWCGIVLYSRLCQL